MKSGQTGGTWIHTVITGKCKKPAPGALGAEQGSKTSWRDKEGSLGFLHLLDNHMQHNFIFLMRPPSCREVFKFQESAQTCWIYIELIPQASQSQATVKLHNGR